MKKIILTLGLLGGCLSVFSQGAVIVSDPTSIAQRLVLASEEMEEQIEQKYKFIEQIDIARKAYEQSEKVRKRVEQVSDYVKKTKEAVEIIALGEDIMNISKALRKSLSSTELINDSQKYQCMVDIINCTTNVPEIAKKATAIIKDKSEENEVTMNDYERHQELRYLKNEMELTKQELLRIYNKSLSISKGEAVSSSLFSFINF